MADCDWWKSLPCHFSTEWNLHRTTEVDLEKLKEIVKVDLQLAPDFMRAESLLYLAYLEVPPKGKSFIRTGMPNRGNALKLIEKAEEYVTRMKDKEAHNGYGIVINTLRMWIFSEQRNTEKQEEVEKRLKELHAYLNDQKVGAFIKVTQAAALSRLGLQRYEEAKTLFQEALTQYRHNTHWMFGWALMQGRLARHAKSRVDPSSDLPQDVKEMFEAEKTKLEEIRQKEPTFAWPIAYLGWCLFNLKEENKALACLEEAMKCDEKNTDIALISGRIYKESSKLDKCKETLESLPEEYKTAEVEFQIALLYNERAKRVFNSKDQQRPAPEDKKKKYTQLLQNALDGVEKALAKDLCHLPAAIKYAEITARCGRREDAMDLYRDLLRREDVQQIAINQVHVRVSFNVVKNSFKTSDVLDNIREMLQLCIRKFTHFNENGEVAFDDLVKRDAERFLKDLNYAIEQPNEESLLAGLILSEVQRGLKSYREAKEIIRTLMQKRCPELEEDIQSNWVERHIVQLIWNYGKCHVGFGNIQRAEKVARFLEQHPPNRQFPAHEIYSDVSLTKAEKELNGKIVSAGLENYNFIVENLHDAISRGSIKACYWYLTKVDDLQERLCSFSDSFSPTILQTIVEIEACIERNDTCHNSFDECADNIEDFIKAKINSVLVHPAQEDPALPQDVQKRYKQLSNLRSYLHKFEGCYRQTTSSREGWNEVCQEKAERVLSHARNILDYVISDYQEKVLQNQNFSGKIKKIYFPIIEDRMGVAVDNTEKQQKAEDEVRKYVEIFFQKNKGPEEEKNKGPEEGIKSKSCHSSDNSGSCLIKYLTKIQPQYSEDNLWLAVLNDFNNNSKHTGKHDNEEIYRVRNREITYPKVDLVRKSCSEVEKIVEEILTFKRQLSIKGSEQMASSFVPNLGSSSVQESFST